MKRNIDSKFKLLAALSLIIVLTVLFFGLRGKGFHFSNDVSWLKDEPGVRFGPYAMAYAHLDSEPSKSTLSAMQSFALEIALQPEDVKPDGFRMILTVHDGDDNRQLIVGQYQSYIVVMNGDDYENKRKVKRLAAPVFSRPNEKLLLTITTGSDGTKLYVNGRPVKAKPDLILKIPDASAPRLTLGNSVDGHSPWKGNVYGLAFYAGPLESGIIENRFSAWSNTQRFPFPLEGQPFLFFPFSEKSGTRAMDGVSGIVAMNMPAGFPVLEKRFLSWPLRDFKANKNFYSDVVLNLLGFMPLGFVLCALFMVCGGRLQKNAAALSVAVCFLISLGIETAQVWMPSRSSQGLDLILNVLGGWIGARVGKSVFKMKYFD